MESSGAPLVLCGSAVGAGYGCACNSRLNLVRLFVNPPHPVRARTPPWGCLCARLRVHAHPHPCAPGCYLACLCMPVRPVCAGAPGYYLCALCACRLCARWCLCAPGCLCAAVCGCASRRGFPVLARLRLLRLLPPVPCDFCCRSSALPACPFASGLLWPAPALPHAGRLARCGSRCCSPLASLVLV